MTFELDKKELENSEKFTKHHRETCVKKFKEQTGHTLALGEYFTWSFTPTGLGNACVVKCNLCGKEENITNYDCW